MTSKRGNIRHLSDLFEKYKTLIKPPQSSVEKAAVRVVGECTPFTITEDQVTYTVGSRTLSFNVPSILKSELKLHFPQIKQALITELGERNAPTTLL